jgi:hypothetical protein
VTPPSKARAGADDGGVSHNRPLLTAAVTVASPARFSAWRREDNSPPRPQSSLAKALLDFTETSDGEETRNPSLAGFLSSSPFWMASAFRDVSAPEKAFDEGREERSANSKRAVVGASRVSSAWVEGESIESNRSVDCMAIDVLQFSEKSRSLTHVG